MYKKRKKYNSYCTNGKGTNDAQEQERVMLTC